MKRFVITVCTLVVAACAKSDTSADTSASADPMPPPAAIKASDVSGNWTVVARNPANDSTLLTYDLAATSDTLWTVTYPNGQKVPVHVMAVAGDSITIHSPPFNSVLRKGVKVETTGVLRLQDGKLVGTTVARYSVKTADSVATIRLEGTRKP